MECLAYKKRKTDKNDVKNPSKHFVSSCININTQMSLLTHLETRFLLVVINILNFVVSCTIMRDCFASFDDVKMMSLIYNKKQIFSV